MSRFLPGNERLQKALYSLGLNMEAKREEISIPADFTMDELAWNFDGEVKYLNDCTKDELLYVIKILCCKLSFASITPSVPSTTDVYTESRSG